MPPHSPIIVGLGELLWDLFPEGPQLGGAPTNFAYYAAQLGNQGIVASRVGRDALGEDAVARLASSGVTTDYLQWDNVAPTGTVGITVDAHGQPTYTIAEGVAWNALAWTPEWRHLAHTADAVCFGSIAQWWHPARETIRAFLRATRPDALRLFDVNLRQTFYTPEILTESLRIANVVKLNHEELPRVAVLLGFPADDDEETCRRLQTAHDLQLVCITRGAHGSLLVTPDARIVHPGVPIQVADTVGAGDAFTAMLAHGYLRGVSLTSISDAANRLGSWVATQTGATPPIHPVVLQDVLNIIPTSW